MRERCDISLVKRGLVESRQKARAMIIAGEVYKNGHRIHKPGFIISSDDNVEVRPRRTPFVSRGGLKLEGALKHFGLDPKDLICLDIGSSTGGFTDCLLKYGAKRVYAVDVGYGLLHYSLRDNPKVVIMERINARFLKKEDFPEKINFITIDCSFISLKLLLPPAFQILNEGGIILPLIKPQFEVGKGEVEKGGVVRDEKKRLKAVQGIIDFSIKNGFESRGIFQSPIKGQKGNIEYFICLYLKKENKN